MVDKLAYERPTVLITPLSVDDMVRTSGDAGLSFNFHDLWGGFTGTFSEDEEA
ncbi:MAG: hypothetical protein IJ514_05235 [Clostridia bacterium]|nr:hypothetical protein [Clostridia bacterium]